MSLSSAVLPQVREYHRLATTVANAYLRPTLGRYLGRLESRLGEAGVRTPRRYVMQSNGGVTTLGRAAERAVATIVSGPAAGVIACETIGRAAGRADLVTFDMGGTSCDVALVRGGRATTTAQTKIAGHDVAVPMLDIHTVSAGGGTIARVERIGGTARLRVGPDSAGARPGPVAYGAGGTQPTITDAHAVLGTLSADAALGGRVSLDVRAAREAVRREIAEPLGDGRGDQSDHDPARVRPARVHARGVRRRRPAARGAPRAGARAARGPRAAASRRHVGARPPRLGRPSRPRALAPRPPRRARSPDRGERIHGSRGRGDRRAARRRVRARVDPAPSRARPALPRPGLRAHDPDRARPDRPARDPRRVRRGARTAVRPRRARSRGRGRELPGGGDRPRRPGRARARPGRGRSHRARVRRRA